jgi:trimeric autotransporter adhesin
VLSGLHATLGISAAAAAVAASTAATASATAAAVAEGTSIAPAAGVPTALGWKSALLTWKAGKVMLATMAVGSAVGVGSVTLQPAPHALREQHGAKVASAAPRDARPAKRGDAEREAPSALEQQNRAPVAQQTPPAAAAQRTASVADQRPNVAEAPGLTGAAQTSAGAVAASAATAPRREVSEEIAATRVARVVESEPRARTSERSQRSAARRAARHAASARAAKAGANQRKANTAVAAVAYAPPSATHEDTTTTAAANESKSALVRESEVVANSKSADAPSGELALLRGALTSIRDGQAERALTLLADHASRYPEGAFANERRGLRVLALCSAGLTAEGEREQAAFLREASASPIAARVRTACSKDTR